jgi:hypothetical protein
MERDPIQEKADKLDKETQETQAKQKAEFEKPRKNMPGEPDQGPSSDIKKGLLKGLEVGGGKSLGMKKGGKTKCMAKGGSASARADGCCVKGKTKGRMV